MMRAMMTARSLGCATTRRVCNLHIKGTVPTPAPDRNVPTPPPAPLVSNSSPPLSLSLLYI